MDILTLIGIAGFGSYIGTYALLQLNRLDGNGVAYTIGNIVGASLVLISLMGQFNLASMLIQVSWIAIGLFGLVKRRRPASDGVVDLDSAPDVERAPAPTHSVVVPQPCGDRRCLRHRQSELERSEVGRAVEVTIG